MLASNSGKSVAQRCPICPLFFRARRGPRRFAGSRPQLTGCLSSTATFPRRIASQVTNTAIKRLAMKIESKEIAMYALNQMSRTTQRTVCTVVSAVIVALWLSLGAYGAEIAAHPGYSVTVTQIQ
jgi:hypothetical protein